MPYFFVLAPRVRATARVACENIRFSLLFVDGRGETDVFAGYNSSKKACYAFKIFEMSTADLVLSPSLSLLHSVFGYTLLHSFTSKSNFLSGIGNACSNLLYTYRRLMKATDCNSIGKFLALNLGNN